MYEMLINIFITRKSIIFFKYLYFINYKQKTNVFVTTQTTIFMKLLKYNIDSQ